MHEWQGLFFWGFLLAFGGVMYLVVPRSKDEAGFFRGHDDQGRPASEWALMLSRHQAPAARRHPGMAT